MKIITENGIIGNPQNPALFQIPEEQVAPYGHFIQVIVPLLKVALVCGEEIMIISNALTLRQI